ncbi:DUF2087 domain-containing protein, partial [Streptomyces sp. JV184]|uniref:DUF2087 domain-containing protein n=1 Tax=Streptomyces sp. JV184 TaxID=858637 RepID=UPI003FA6905D
EQDAAARRAVLGHVARSTYAVGDDYDERTVTDRLQPWCAGGVLDAVSLRRALVDDGILARESGRYRLAAAVACAGGRPRKAKHTRWILGVVARRGRFDQASKRLCRRSAGASQASALRGRPE